MKINFPNDWKILKIGNLHNRTGNIVQTGPFGAQLHSADYVKEGVPFILIRNFKNNKIDTSDMPFITEEDAERLKRYRLKEGDIIFSRVGRIGDTVYVEDYMDGWTISGQLLRIRSEDESTYNKFLNYIIKSDYVQRQINANYVGSTRKSLNSTILEQLKFPQPSIKEQKRIVSILDNLQILIGHTQSFIEKLQILKKGLMQRLFTEGIGHTEFKETRLGKIPKEWEIRNLEEMGAFQYGYTTSAISNDTGVKFLRITDINENGFFNWDDIPFAEIDSEDIIKFILKEGDILIARIGATTGKTCYIDNVKGDIIFASYLIRFKTNKTIIPKFVFYYSQTKIYDKFIYTFKEGKLKKGINAQELKKFKIPIPKVEEQKKIVLILSNLDNKIINENQNISILKEIKKGLMEDLLTGKKRVKIN